MKRPTEIQLGAINWEVHFEKMPESVLEDFGCTSRQLLGLTRTQSLKIIIIPNLDPVVERITFLHELVHAMAHSFGLGFDTGKKEDVVDKIASAFYYFIKDNPETVKWLMKEAKNDTKV